MESNSVLGLTEQTPLSPAPAWREGGSAGAARLEVADVQAAQLATAGVVAVDLVHGLEGVPSDGRKATQNLAGSPDPPFTISAGTGDSTAAPCLGITSTLAVCRLTAPYTGRTGSSQYSGSVRPAAMPSRTGSPNTPTCQTTPSRPGKATVRFTPSADLPAEFGRS